ncbi:AAA family ATPase, partial [bacterium]|nr:AAA family ATPase [bacterium]
MEPHTKVVKILPHDLDLEANVLGILIAFGNETKVTARETLSEDDFYKTAHRHIFTASLEARDITHLIYRLQKADLLEEVGGKDYITKIAETAGIPAALPALTEILKELSQRRRLILSTMKILEEAYAPSADVNQLILEAIKTLCDSCQDGGGIVQNPELAQIVFKDIETRSREGIRDVGLLSGLEILNSHLYGFENKTLSYVVGRPGMGKTALVLNIAAYMADHYPGTVLFYSLEMGREALFRRRLAARSGIYLSRLRNADIGDPQWPDLIQANDKLAKSDLMIFDNTKFRRIEDLVANAHALASEH